MLEGNPELPPYRILRCYKNGYSGWYKTSLGRQRSLLLLVHVTACRGVCMREWFVWKRRLVVPSGESEWRSRWTAMSTNRSRLFRHVEYIRTVPSRPLTEVSSGFCMLRVVKTKRDLAGSHEHFRLWWLPYLILQQQSKPPRRSPLGVLRLYLWRLSHAAGSKSLQY